jgi:hypothetical protein
MLRAALQGDRVGLTWEGATLPVDRTEVHRDPFALARQGGDESFGLANGTRTFTLAVNSSWNLGVFVGYRVEAHAWDEQQGYGGPAGSMTVRLVDPQGAPRRQATVELPYEHASFSHGPLEPGAWELVVDTVSQGGPGVAGAEVYWSFDI